MLKLIFFLLFIFPLCFINLGYWMVQNFLFLLSFIFILFNYSSNYFINISYYLGYDIISYGLILLRLWICSLILIARESVLKFNNYSSLFLINVLFLLIFLILTFRRINLFLFYFFFERRLIPTLFLILGW
jgi:NADH-ubiquinone oxidoreductase chain 4